MKREAKVQKLLEEKERELRTRSYTGHMAKVVSVIAVIWSLFQLYATSFGVFDSISLRAWHITFLLTMAVLIYPGLKREKRVRKFPTIVDFIFIALSIGAFAYLLHNYKVIALRGGYLLPRDYQVPTVIRRKISVQRQSG